MSQIWSNQLMLVIKIVRYDSLLKKSEKHFQTVTPSIMIFIQLLAHWVFSPQPLLEGLSSQYVPSDTF